MLAPEILSVIRANSVKDVFDEQKSDIFALGVTLFQSLFLRTPFAKEYASINDAFFKHFFAGKPENFWGTDEIQNILCFIRKQENFREEQFVDLINGMLSVNPKQRLTIDQVINHPWFQ